MSAQDVKDEFGMDPEFIDSIRPFFEFLYYIYFRVEARGVSNVPARGPAIIVANHSGTFPYDGTMIHLAVYNNLKEKRFTRFLVENFVFGVPLLGKFISLVGGVRACHENATALLKRRELVAVFPEGISGIGKTYDGRYKLERFGHGGFVKLAMRTKAPIIPAAVIGAEEIHPLIWKSQIFAKTLGLPYIPFTPTFPWLGPLGLVPLPSKWRIVFGEPVSFARFKRSDAENERLVKKHAEAIRNSIQETINEELKRRKSIWV